MKPNGECKNKAKFMFEADVLLSPSDKETRCVQFSIDSDGGGIEDSSLTYDDVEMAAYESMLGTYRQKYYPYAEIGQIFHLVREDYGIVRKYPVVPEAVDGESSESSKKYMEDIVDRCGTDKFLVLPFARYSLTDEYRLFSALKGEGVLGEDAVFDYAAMHATLAAMGRHK